MVRRGPEDDWDDLAYKAVTGKSAPKTIRTQIRALGGVRAVAQRYGVSTRTVQRWNAGAAKPTKVRPEDLRHDSRDDPTARTRAMPARRRTRLGRQRSDFGFRGVAGPPAPGYTGPAPAGAGLTDGIRWRSMQTTGALTPEQLGAVTAAWEAGAGGEQIRAMLSGAIGSTYMADYPGARWYIGDASEVQDLRFGPAQPL